jgi:L-histidine N-alpha-methyltransferase
MASSPIVAAVAHDANERRRLLMLADVRDGLSRTPRELSPKYFYDDRGSRLFEEITQLPEYYLTRAEREILLARAGEIAYATRPRTLVELGAGSASKTRILLDALERLDPQAGPVTYVPVDVSADFLEETRRALEAERPLLRVAPLVADIGDTLDLSPSLPGPMLFAFLGSTIGNFDGPGAVALLRRVRAHMRAGDHLLLGTDLRKDPAVLNAAYNDRAGITAEFNRNGLRVLNAELGADFDVDRFEHRAFYDEAECRIEMHLDAKGTQTVTIPGLAPLVFRDGESIRTELSHKYDRAAVDALASAARMRVSGWFTDEGGRFALSVIEPAA